MRAIPFLLLAFFVAGCSGRQSAGGTLPAAAPRSSQTDVDFVHAMIAHHAQAVTMAQWAPAHAGRDEIRLLAERIDVAQQDEIRRMRQWLERRGAAATDTAHAHHTGMSGMATMEQMQRLAAAHGPPFDSLFLELMIRHHEGALVMVEELAAAGGPRDAELYQLVSHIDADQRAEITRMQRLLTSIRERGEQ